MPTVSTRFSIRNNNLASKFFDKLLEEIADGQYQFYVTGTADHSIQWGNCEETKLIEIMSRMTSLSKDIPNCFNDVITRVGLDYIESNNSVQNSIRRPNISSKVDKYRQIMRYLRREIKKANSPSWKYALCKLLGTLDTMLGNYVMDDLAYLIIPGVDAFLERLYYIMTRLDDYELYPEYIGEITDFLNHWTNLTNDIAQLESQLTQHPELAPVRYYIPAMGLQFILRFLEYCSIALSDTGERDFHPMLVPRIDIDNMYTTCPLDPGSSKYQGKCPLLVFIPIEDLYRPWDLVHRATHEIAHYCVDAARLRKDRHAALAYCLAVYIINEWYALYVKNVLNDHDGALRQNSNAYIPKLAKIILSMTSDYVGNTNDIHLRHSCEELVKTALRIYANDSFLEQYLYSIDNSYFYRNRDFFPRVYADRNGGEQYLAHCHNVRDYIDLLAHLCGECYADLAMILLLQCNFTDYYTCIYHDEYKKLEKDEYIGVSSHPLHPNVLRHIMRMSLVIDVLSEVKPDTSIEWVIPQISRSALKKYPWVGFAKELVEGMRCADETHGKNPFVLKGYSRETLLIDCDAYHALRGYLVCCAKELKKKLNCSTSTDSKRMTAIAQIRENESYLVDGKFDLDAIQRFLLQESE